MRKRKIANVITDGKFIVGVRRNILSGSNLLFATQNVFFQPTNCSSMSQPWGGLELSNLDSKVTEQKAVSLKRFLLWATVEVETRFTPLDVERRKENSQYFLR